MINKKIHSAFLIGLLIFFSLGFYACNNDDDNNNSVVTTKDKNFARNISGTNFTEIQFSQLASQKATLDTIVKFATQMITDHTKAGTQLDSIANKLNIQLSDSMDAAHRTLYDSLSLATGAGFDSVYVHNQVTDHQLTLEMLQDEIDNGSNDGLMNFARKQVPIVTMHLQEVIAIRTFLDHQGQNQ